MPLILINQNSNINFYKNHSFSPNNEEINNMDLAYNKPPISDIFVRQEQAKTDMSTKASEQIKKNLKQLLILAGIIITSVFVLKSKKHQPPAPSEKYLNPTFLKRVKKLKEMGIKDIDTRFMNKQFERYTDNELENIVDPFLQSSKPFNDTLRKELNDKGIMEKVTQIDKLIEKAKPLKKEAIVYRAIDGSFAEQFVSNFCNNKFVIDKGYISTGTKLTQGEFTYFAQKEDSVILRIYLPKGTKGLYPSVSEITLPRNSQLKFVSFDKELKIIDCEYILPKN